MLMSWMHVEPRSVQALNETTFLVTYVSGIFPDEIGSAVEKIEDWLGKAVVIICNEVTTNQLPQVIECAWDTTGVDSVVFNTRIDDMHSDPNQSVQSGYHHYTGSPAVPGASGTTILNKIPGILCFSGTEREKDTVQFEQWLHAISDAWKNLNKQLVRAAINKSCVGDVADAICCLPPMAALDDVFEKFKWLCGSVEFFNTLMQEFYRIVQGKIEKVQTFVHHLERALKAIKQQHPYAITKEEGTKHLEDCLFHELKLNIHNALHYMYDKPDSQYSQLVMASRKAETEIPGSSVSKARAKSAMVETDTASQVKVASSDLSYEALTQQIAYLMSVVTNQTNWNLSKDNECNGSKSSNGNDKYSSTKFQRPKRDRKNMKCWGCGGPGHSWRECYIPRQGNNLPFKLNNQNQNQNNN